MTTEELEALKVYRVKYDSFELLVVARSFGEAMKVWQCRGNVEPDSVELLCGGGEPIEFAPGVRAALLRRAKK